MITIITKVIIAQMDRFFKNSFNLLFVERKFGKIKIRISKEYKLANAKQAHEWN